MLFGKYKERLVPWQVSFCVNLYAEQTMWGPIIYKVYIQNIFCLFRELQEAYCHRIPSPSQSAPQA